MSFDVTVKKVNMVINKVKHNFWHFSKTIVLKYLQE